MKTSFAYFGRLRPRLLDLVLLVKIFDSEERTEFKSLESRSPFPVFFDDSDPTAAIIFIKNVVLVSEASCGGSSALC